MTLKDQNTKLSPRELAELEDLLPDKRVARLAELSARVAQGVSDEDVSSLAAEIAANEEHPEVRMAWVAYSAASTAASFASLLEDWLNDSNEEHRLHVVSALAWNRGLDTNNILLRLISSDPSQRVRRRALKYLVRRGTRGDWQPFDLAGIVRENDWRPTIKREYTKLLDH